MSTATPPQVVQLNCPSCRTPLRAQIVTVIDAGRQPELKGRLLAGQLNLAVCPACGTPVMLGAPLFYHDAEKQLALAYFPAQLNSRPEEQERFIGEAAGLFMRALPANAPRGHLLAPRRFLTLNSLIDAVLEADGVSRETIEAQRRRVELISRLAEAAEQGDEALAAVVDESRADLDAEFFAALDAFVEASRQVGRGDSAEALGALRDQVAALVGYASDDDDFGEPDVETAAVVERLRAAADDELEAQVAELRPALDYSFFAAWTDEIEAAERAGAAEEAARLTARRARILELVERMDREAQAMFDAGSALLREVLAAPDVEAALRERREQIDEAFMLVVETNVAAAQRAGQQELAAQLSQIATLATQVVEEALTPEERFINQLLQVETPQEATRMLRQNVAMVTPAFVKRVNELAEQMEGAGRKPLGERLRQLGREASVMLF